MVPHCNYRTHWYYGLLLNTVQWLFDSKQFDWFGGDWLSAHILVVDYIWKMLETEVIFESAASSDTIYFQINICR